MPLKWLVALVFIYPMVSLPPAWARLGETKALSKKMVQQAKPKPDTRFILYYSNDKGIIIREYWEAYEQLWSIEEADRYRQLIMGNLTPSQVDRVMTTRAIFFYDNGSRVIYSLLGERVVSIIAIAKEYRQYPM